MEKIGSIVARVLDRVRWIEAARKRGALRVGPRRDRRTWGKLDGPVSVTAAGRRAFGENRGGRGPGGGQRSGILKARREPRSVGAEKNLDS
jgi:hypothetical protein